jgi:hypothetical protein
MELPKLEVSGPDLAGDPVLHFFTPPQYAALRRLGDLLMPAMTGSAGALAARSPEFLDFLLSQSPADRKQLYRSGLDAANATAQKRYAKPFADLDDTQASAIMAPLREAWTYHLPTEPLARFLFVAKQDFRTATMNSREYAGNASGGGGRRMLGGGNYWYPLD